jgi:hypothetical protein
MSCTAQTSPDLLSVPDQSIDLRLKSAAHEMDQASEFRSMAAWSACIAGLFIAADRLNNPGSPLDFSTGVACLGGVAYIGLNAVGTKHDRKAAEILRGHRE